MIKKLLLFVALGFPMILQAQNSKMHLFPSLGIDMGGAVPFPLSDIPEGAKGVPKINPNIGLGLVYNLSEKWSLNFEPGYHILAFSATADVRSQPFYFDNQTEIIYFTGHTETDVRICFLELPLIAGYQLNSNWSLMSGIYYSRIFEATFNTKGSDGVTSSDKNDTDNAVLPGIAAPGYEFNDYMEKWDAGLLIGFRYSLNSRMCFHSRLTVGFNSVFKDDFDNIDYEMYQVRLNTGITINLFR